MNKNIHFKERKGISPIIATLLLILIAIAAGVIVYAYVVGFIGNSTSNSGGTTNTLSIDQVTFSSKTANFPVTAYVRNEGPSTESFDTGFFVKGSSLNDQLVPAVSLTAATPGDSITVGTVALAEASSSTMTVTITTSACTSTSDEINVNGFGATQQVTTGTCTVSGAGTLTATLTLPTGVTVSTSPSFAASASSLSLTVTGSSAFIVGTAVSAGTVLIAVNSVGTLALAIAGKQTSNPLSAGQTYTFQVTGTDGASTTASGKSS